MRNTLQYPLRDEEVIAYLDRKLAEYQESGLIGGMDMVIIQHLKGLVAKNPLDTTTSTTTARD